jgi:hypothetical protein
MYLQPLPACESHAEHPPGATGKVGTESAQVGTKPGTRRNSGDVV